MKIIIISGFFYPTNSPRSFRSTELVKRYAQEGHEVTLYIPYTEFDYTSFLFEYPICIKFYERNYQTASAGILYRIKARLQAQFLEYPDITIVKGLKRVLFEESGYDLMITIAMPHPIHWAVGQVYEKKHIIAKTWVADCGDPYMLCGTNQYIHPFYLKKQEIRWCKYCNYISVPTIAAKNGYYSEFHHKIKVIPQAFNFNEIKLDNYTCNKVPTFAFSGNIIPHVRDPRPFLDYLASIKADFRFVMFTTKHHLVKPYGEILSDKLEVRGYIPRLELLYTLSNMDFLVNIENSTSVQSPSKLIDYALTQRPILSINPLMLDTNLIDQFLEGNYQGQYIVKNVEQYNIENVAELFLSLVSR